MTSVQVPQLQELYPELRKGKWTKEEEEYASKLISFFNMGVVRVSQGVTLRAFLSEKLHCDPMRITKKYTGSDCIGKQVFLAPHHDEKTIKKYENELKKMEKIFVMKLISKRKENNLFYARSLPKPKRSFSSTPSSGSKEVSSYTSNSINNSIKTKISNSGVVKEVTTPKKKNNKKRVNSAPDLASLDTVQLNDQCDGEDAPPPKKKRMKGVGIPRSRSMQSFDSFAEMDIHAAETLRKNYAEHNSIENEQPGEKSRGSLPSFFSSEATSMEAAKYNKNCQQSSHLQNMDVKSENNVSAFSLFSHLATPSGNDNSDFFELEERIPFSDNKKEPEIFVDQSEENDIKEENVTSQNDVDDSGFFIGSGTDIE